MIPAEIADRARRVLEACREQGLRLATAESCTGGLIAAALTELAGSSDVVDRGFVTYSNEAKTELLAVPPPDVAEHGAVSEPVARAMAEGALAHSRADIAVSCTGIAGPGGATPTKPVGLVHMACARKGRETLHERRVFRGGRAAVREATVVAALDMVLRQAMRGARRVTLPGRAAPRRAIGVDFSGARQAGRGTWIATGAIEADSVRIESCVPAAELPGGAPDRDRALAALVEYLASQSEAIVGCDFPFGLPAAFVRDKDWTAFVRAFPRRFPNPDALAALGGTPRTEPKRRTDIDAKTPFSAINLKMYRQTWAGIALVLRPLLDRGARIVPMQEPVRGKPLIVEICPASTLKAQGLYNPYKGRSAQHRFWRRAILDALVARGALEKLPRQIEAVAINDIQGDALDAILAAIAAHRALYDPRLIEPCEGDEAVEGRVYF